MSGLGTVFDAAVRTAVVGVFGVGSAVGVVVGTYTPAGGAAQSAHAAVRIHEEDGGAVQERAATITLFQAEIATEPTDGATFVTASDTWTIRTAVRRDATFACEAWA